MIVASFTNRIDTHGLLIWLPAMPSATAAEIIRQDIMEAISGAASADEVLERLDIRGFALTLNVEHHGSQDYRRWSLTPRDDTWAAARCREAAA